MISTLIRLTPEMKLALEHLKKKTGASQAYHIRCAIEAYISLHKEPERVVFSKDLDRTVEIPGG